MISSDILGQPPVSVLCLHGGGKDRSVYAGVRQHLFERGISSAGLDFPGHGQSTGPLEGSSLRARTEAAIKVIRRHEMREPLTISGASMGAYTAIKLTEQFAVDCLVLVVPAVYAVDAYDLLFGSTFTERIRMPRSWEATDAFEILGRFKGELLVVAAGEDKIIPQGVIDRIMASATAARNKELVVIDGAPHQIFNYLLQNPIKEQLFYSFLDKFVH